MRTKAKVRITKDLVKLATRGTPWDLGNKVLYDLCEQYPGHDQVDQIIAKVWLIGRAYSAAIERRRHKTAFQGDAFYTDYVAPKMRDWRTDRWLSALPAHEDLGPENLDQVLSCHKQLTEAFHKLTKLDKRSLASKYLHFHFPRLFFIYDTRAEAGLRHLSVPAATEHRSRGDADSAYSRFCLKCLALRDHVERRQKVRLTPRQLDNLLLEVTRIGAESSKSRARAPR